MARTQARVLCTIWDDEDFLRLEQSAQRMYLFLVSQRDLNHAGLVPLRARRWASKSADLDPTVVQAALDTLEAASFILVDYDTEEVLIRTLVRNDGVYKQPRVMIRMREDAKQISSQRLRLAFRRELERLPLDELSDAPGGRNGDEPSIREVVAGIVRTLLDVFPVPDANPSTGVSDTHPDTPVEGYAEPPYVRAHTFLQPPSSDLPPPSTTLVAASGNERAPRRSTKTALPNDWRPTDEHKAYAAEHGLDLRAEVEAFRFHALANDRRMVRWNATFSGWLANATKWSGRSNAAPTRSTTDDRVRGWLDLAQQPKIGEIA